jgi:membrane glycosyltransferase
MVPFSLYCELPALPGREPFGGRILSHDFVEAALMVRAGWEAWLAYDLRGTYEESPPTLVDHLKRDRRWCQGNLQHLWLVFAKKLPLASRIHLFMGIMAYLGSPLWFLFLLFGTWIAWDRVASKLSLVVVPGIGGRLCGWSAVEQSVGLACFVFGLLLLPRVLALTGTIFSPARKRFGGTVRILIGAALELVMSTLLAPAVMIAHTGIVLSMVAGRAVGWGTQNRVADGTGWREALQVHWPAVVAGLVWAVAAWQVGPGFLKWFAPILLGMGLSPLWSVVTSKASLGKRLRAWRILATPEEIQPPQVALDAEAAAGLHDPALVTEAPSRRGVIAAVVDPYVNGVHVSLVEQEELDEARQRLVERWLAEGPGALERAALMDALHDGAVMLQMHRSVWMRPADGLHPAWREAVASYREHAESSAA